MISHKSCLAILDTINHPIVFVDNEHVVRYLNRLAEKRYYGERGYSDLIGKSLFDCHNPKSHEKIKALYGRLQKGEDEIFNWVNEQGERITVVAVRDQERNLIGYYERFEKVGNP
jgi:PAS domain S-box-containing protein